MRTLTIRCLATGIRLGHLVYQVNDDAVAIRSALLMARLSSAAACIDATGFIVYPDGRAGNVAWILTPQSN